MKTVESNTSKSSVLDTSLTELAFIFFFILLLVSVWKLNEQEEKLSKLMDQESKISELKEVNSELKEVNKEQAEIIANLEAVSALIESINAKVGEDNFEEFFTEIAKLKEKVQRAEQLEVELKEAQSQLSFFQNEMTELLKTDDKQKILEEIREVAVLKTLLAEVSPNGGDPSEILKQILLERNDALGQNNNLRQKIAQIGNGRDHPPCWADAKTGAIQFMFDVTILEDGVVFARGWPEVRNEQAMANPAIQAVLGEYKDNAAHIAKTRPIFEESVKNSCRHFVRISDKAISKDAFKKHLMAIEVHFYKLLTEVKYGGG